VVLGEHYRKSIKEITAPVLFLETLPNVRAISEGGGNQSLRLIDDNESNLPYADYVQKHILFYNLP
jgi:hypothetical protein